MPALTKGPLMTARSRGRLLGVIVVLSALLGSCTASTTVPIGQFGGHAVLGISNGTPLEVTLYLNGQAVGTAKPGIGLEPIDFDSLPPPPWTVEARSASGRVLAWMALLAGSVSATTGADGHIETSGPFGRVDLSCGRITIWAGYNQPSGPVPASPAGSPGDCVP